MSTLSKSVPLPLYLPFNRSRALESTTAVERAAEHTRAKMVELLVDGRQRSLVKQARKGSRLSAAELYAMVKRFPHVDDWRSGSLWRMLGMAMQSNGAVVKPAKPMKEIVKQAPIVETIPQDELRAGLLVSGNSYATSLATSRLTGVSETTVRAFMNGKNVTPRIAVKLLGAIQSEVKQAAA